MLTPINLGKLWHVDHAAYQALVDDGIISGNENGVEEFDIDALAVDDLIRQHLHAFARRTNPTARILPPRQEPAPATPDPDEAERKRKMVILSDQNHGENRFKEYVYLHGLFNTSENRAVFQSFFDKHSLGNWSWQGVDAVVLNHGPRGDNTLTWRAAVPPSAPPPPTKPVLEPLSNGEERLPNPSPAWVMKQSSTEQLKDLARRSTQGKP